MSLVTRERKGAAVVLTYANPPWGTMTAAGAREMYAEARTALDDPEVRCLVLTGGVPGIFIRHYDVDELADMSARLQDGPPPAPPRTDTPPPPPGFLELTDIIAAADKPVVAAINGLCQGGGFELALACDIRIATPDAASIGLPETRIGIFPGGGGTQRLPRVVGEAKALEIILRGLTFTGAEAHAIGADLPWLADPLARALEHQRGHALLVHGAPGAGAFEFALAFAQARLCEASEAARLAAPCAACASCRAVAARLHPDLFVLLPEQLRQERGWLLAGDKPDSTDDEGATKAGKRKPSRQIRMQDVRRALDWVVTTRARSGQAKVLVLHPATALNGVSASALLKMLEEPPQGVRIVLTASDPARLLPTLLSRCQRLRLPEPPTGPCLAWLAQQGVARPEVMLAAAGGLPLEAFELHAAGIGAAQWAGVPQAVRQGHAAFFEGWGVRRVVDAMVKLCHDAMVEQAGGAARFFPATARPLGGSPQALAAWHARLRTLAPHVDHPWNEPLTVEALVLQGQSALGTPARFATLRP